MGTERHLDSFAGIAILALVMLFAAPTAVLAETQGAYSLVAEWGSPGTGDGEFNEPWGIAVDASDDVYVADTGNHRIQKFDSDGNYLLEWGGLGTGDGEFINPTGIAVSPQGKVHVGDLIASPTGWYRLQRFNTSGDFERSTGSTEGYNVPLEVPLNPFTFPMSLATDSDGNLYSVRNWAGGEKYSPEGDSLLTLPGSGNNVWNTVSVAVAPAGDIYLGMSDMHGLLRLDASGSPIREFESSEDPGGSFAEFPYAMATDDLNRVYVVWHSWIQVFDRNLMPLTRIEWGDDDSRGVALDSQGNVYVSTLSNRIMKFAPAEAAQVSAWPRSSLVESGDWAKIGGTVKDSSSAPIEGAGLYIQTREKTELSQAGVSKSAVNPWQYLGMAYSDENGYFQKWFKADETKEYRAVYKATNVIASNVFTIKTIQQMTAWNAFPSLTYWGWTKTHGLAKDMDGDPVPATSVYLQVWDYAKKKWVWVATDRTTPTGYFSFWHKPYGTTHYRVATWGSASASYQITKTVHKKVLLDPGATRLNLGSSTRIEVEIQPRHPGSVGYFQVWDFATKKWVWIKTLTMDSSSQASYSWRPKTKGWHAIRIHAPRHWDHEESHSAIHWIEVR